MQVVLLHYPQLNMKMHLLAEGTLEQDASPIIPNCSRHQAEEVPGSSGQLT